MKVSISAPKVPGMATQEPLTFLLNHPDYVAPGDTLVHPMPEVID